MLITNTTILRADGRVEAGRDIGIRDGRIVAVGPAGRLDAAAEGWGETVDGSRRLVMPGMVNSHTHVSMTLLRGYGEDMALADWLNTRIFPFEALLTGEDVYWGALLGIAEMLMTGTTSFTDMYFFCDRDVQAVLESGIKANIGRGTTCFETDKRYRDLPAYEENEALLRDAQGAGDGRVRVDVAPHAEYTTRPDILADMADQAARHGARMHIHLSETREEHLACTGRHGMTPARLLEETGVLALPLTAAHCVWLTDSDMALLASRGVTAAHCPQSNLKLAGGIAPVERMRRAGMRVALGTDSAASNNNLNMLEEARLAALLAKGTSLDPRALPAGEALRMLTREGALSQGREDCGDVAEGLRADLVMLDADAVSLTPCHDAAAGVLYAAGTAEVRMTMVDGRVLYRDGELLTLDRERIRYEVRKSVKTIVEKRGASAEDIALI